MKSNIEKVLLVLIKSGCKFLLLMVSLIVMSLFVAIIEPLQEPTDPIWGLFIVVILASLMYTILEGFLDKLLNKLFDKSSK